jgi:preprotein translocase subunit SecA
MIGSFFSKILDVNQKEIKRLSLVVDKINSLEGKFRKLKDSDFTAKTQEFKKSINSGIDPKEILPEAFALVREAGRRALGLRLYDVQLMAGVALFEGKVAEQKTGEGKTLSAVPALYLRALEGKGAHLVTVNDYLARRDSGWNGPIFNLLGMSVGSIIQEGKSFIFDPDYNDPSHGDERLSHLRPVDRKTAYLADVTYGTNNEFGFDYLRDNLVQSLSEMVQRGHHFAIVDEVDSVLIDEARTPLIISAPDTEPTEKYYQFAKIVEKLNPDTDFVVDEKLRAASLTEHGITRLEKILGVANLYERDFETIHHVENALKARTLFLRDRDYIVKDGQVIIVDEFTGRLMFGRRWGDGLHQAVEAKEGVAIQQESKTYATISFQNYFRMYKYLSGMTGTAATEAEEFKKIYNLDVVVIPTNKPMIRIDHPDIVYKSLSAKYAAIVKDIEDRHKKGQPVLVGTTSIEKNEILSDLLKHKRIPHNVLNAKNHEKEAQVIADAGKPGAVTVATNMAGRGVDIVLGGAQPQRKEGQSDEEYRKSREYKQWEEAHRRVIEAGGLYIIGTERHESRRIDNQLRGRSGRQGDPGESRFYLSLEDDLMRIFGGEQMIALMDRLHVPDDQPIENKLVSRAIEQAQVKVEGFHFDSRKSVVEYDDVANQHREVIYKLRRKVLESEDVRDEIFEILHKEVDRIIGFASGIDGKVDHEKIVVGLLEIVPFDEPSREKVKSEIEKSNEVKEIKKIIEKIIRNVHSVRESQVGEEVMRQIEKFAYLSSIDHQWVEHLDAIEGLREGVRLRAYGQRDALAEFKSEAFTMFENLMGKIESQVARSVFRIGVAPSPAEIPVGLLRTNEDQIDKTGLLPASDGEITAQTGQPAFANISSSASSSPKKIGRNDPCWCGSGKKWKKCHYPQLP